LKVIQQDLEMPGMVKEMATAMVKEMATAMVKEMATVKEMAKEMEVVEMTKEMEVVEMTKEMVKEMVMTTVEVVEEVEVAMGIYLRNRILCT
jgi:hypothetical protein